MVIKNRNLELAGPVNRLLDEEAESGGKITTAVSAAIYWYFNRLEAHQRELARRECGEWLRTGKLPPDAIATEMERVLRSGRERGSPRSRQT